MKTKARNYTKEFKEEAIKLALDSTSVAQTSKDLGVPISTLHCWINQAKVLDFGASKSRDSQVKLTMNDLLERNKELLRRINSLEVKTKIVSLM